MIINTFLHRLFAALVVMSPALASATEVSSLKDSISFAIEHNRMLAASSNQVSAAFAQADAVSGQLLPRIDVSTGLYRTNSPLNSFGTKLQQQSVTQADFNPALLNSPEYINNYQSRLGLSLPLFSGGANWAARAGAKHQAEAAELKFEFHKQQLIFQTISAYVNSRQALAQLNAQEHAVNAAEKRWLDAKAMAKKGMTIASDVMDAHVHLLRSKVALNQAQSSYANSLESLRLILGMKSGSELGALTEPAIHFTADNLDSLITGAMRHRADLLALQSEVEAAGSARTQAQAGYYPHVNLIAAQEWNSDTLALENSNTTVGINISMNIFAGGADSARSRAAESQRIILGLQLDDKQQQIENEIQQAWRSVNTAQQRLSSESEAQKQTAESLRIKSLRHKQGLEKTSDLLDAQVRADASNVAVIRAKYDFMIAKAALLLAAGTLNEEVVQ